MASLLALLPNKFGRARSNNTPRTTTPDDDGEVRRDRSQPRNWSERRKVFDTSMVVLLEATTAMISNTGATAADHAHKDLKISRTGTIAVFASTYLIAQALGAVIFPPFTESFGRKKTYIVTTVLYSLFTALVMTGKGGKPHLAAIIIGRLFSGMMSAIPSVVVIGSIEDMWSPRARIFPIQAWVSVSVMGLVFGPAFATVIADRWQWRMIYGISAIIVAIQALLICFIKESRPKCIPEIPDEPLPRTEPNIRPTLVRATSTHPTLKQFAKTSLDLPIRLFFGEPLVFAVTIMSATVFSLLYLFTEAFIIVYTDFGFAREKIAYINTLMAIGPLFPVLVRLRDIKVGRKRKAQGRQITPEDKLLGFFIAAPIFAAALWIFSWTVPPLTHISPWVSASSLIPIGYAVSEFDHVLSSYLADSYAHIAGSASAPLAFLRASLSAVFPLIGEAMFKNMGSNYAGTVLAVMATAYCGVAVWFGLKGKELREGSKWIKRNAVVVEERRMDDPK
ncbi:MFS general substrate transporter [Tothia fuscella]|uniref:MFS general substrate transporter n=1 Tax=Tothia fuscella TaxID=1048955 RepID=A0A9P4U3Q4_9PEZI|nr:MFS general substrate transporter [Tothia fuscella]